MSKEPEQATRKSLHAQLKRIVSDELERLPETLEKLEPNARVKYLLQLLPYVAPKIEAVGDDYGEGVSFDIL